MPKNDLLFGFGILGRPPPPKQQTGNVYCNHGFSFPSAGGVWVPSTVFLTITRHWQRQRRWIATWSSRDVGFERCSAGLSEWYRDLYVQQQPLPWGQKIQKDQNPCRVLLKLIIIWIFYNLVRDVCWTPTGWFCDQIHWQELRWLETHVLTSQWVMLHYVHNHLTGFALTCFNLLQISKLSVSPCSQKLCFFQASFQHWVVVTVETSKLLVLKAMDVF